MGDFLSLLLNIILVGLVGGFVIWVVSRLNLGLTVDGFGTAFIASFVIAIVGGIIYWLLGLLGITIGGGFFGAIVNLIIAAVILMVSGSFLPGMTVAGFGGAIVAAIGIGVVTWLVEWILGFFA